ncbi:Hypp2621 [Branchiostoma lanceolatum]|uniref:Hypp2621 protein n=1 Tax=Branchiostoma lanceolatum TaxID=7740 RepID=A0A8J9ZUM1_BRALA|nr:Hypp2621 [Branchiostoma lanceolatum]
MRCMDPKPPSEKPGGKGVPQWSQPFLLGTCHVKLTQSRGRGYTSGEVPLPSKPGLAGERHQMVMRDGSSWRQRWVVMATEPAGL